MSVTVTIADGFVLAAVALLAVVPVVMAESKLRPAQRVMNMVYVVPFVTLGGLALLEHTKRFWLSLFAVMLLSPLAVKYLHDPAALFDQIWSVFRGRSER